ncbi:MAG: hypothetical protein FWC57_03075, partial [Endomicrobia bacterium]|nr:hypothetical protein [Endomicrobiia bacterium]
MFKKLKIKTLVFSIAALAFASGGLYAQSVNNWNDFNDAIAGGATSIAFTTDTVLFSNNLPQINYAGPVTFSGSVTLDGGTLYQIFNIANTAAVFNDSINFVDAGNSASGGALSASGNSTVSFNGAYVNFRNNYSGQTAQGGGGAGIYITGAASVEFNVSTAVFTNNSAASWGAGIDLLNGGTLSMNADYIEFSSNTALGRGAAIAATYGNTINLNAGSVVFYNNRAENTPASPNITGDPLYRGGALLSQQANYYIKADDIKFINNYAKGWGGAIFSGSNLGGGGRSYLSFESGSILFDGNKADAKAGLLDVGASLGGAIAATATDMYFSGGQAVFSNNSVAGSAGAGGAFLISGNSDVHFNSDITGFNSNTGAIGGAIALRSSTITFAPQNYVQFTNNSTSGMGTLGGGAIYSESSIMKFTGGQTLFSGNAAKSGIGSTVGGAIHMTSASKAEFASSSVNFTSNTASTNGGAVYEEAGSNSVFTGADVVFNTNSAGAAASAYGGALFADSSSYLFANNTTVFSGNKAGGRGGALYAA